MACYDGIPEVEDVREILTSALTDAQIEALILDAELMVRGCVASLDEEVACTIIKYAAADMAVLQELGGAGALTSKKLGDAAETYAVSTLYPGHTTYWDTAVRFDPNGCLLKLGRRSAFFEKV